MFYWSLWTGGNHIIPGLTVPITATLIFWSLSDKSWWILEAHPEINILLQNIYIYLYCLCLLQFSYRVYRAQNKVRDTFRVLLPIKCGFGISPINPFQVKGHSLNPLSTAWPNVRGCPTFCLLPPLLLLPVFLSFFFFFLVGFYWCWAHPALSLPDWSVVLPRQFLTAVCRFRESLSISVSLDSWVAFTEPPSVQCAQITVFLHEKKS